KPAPKPSLHRLVPLLPPRRLSHRPLFALRLTSRRHTVSSSSVHRLPLPLELLHACIRRRKDNRPESKPMPELGPLTVAGHSSSGSLTVA
ncbi:hypothetical protein HN51_059526, partial [Arachis hypogaea]